MGVVVVAGFVPITQMEKLRLRVKWHCLQLVSSEFGFGFPVAFVLWRLGKVKTQLQPFDRLSLRIELG